jgi:peptide/nickel transport system permease protein
MIKKLRQNTLAFISLIVLVVLYAGAAFAGFLSTYHYDNEAREYSYAPPTRIHWYDRETGRIGPYVCRYDASFDEYYRRVYTEDCSRRYPVRILARGDDYRLLGLFRTNIHLLGVDPEARLYLLGADARGRDLLSRVLYGARVSLSVGLIGALISFVIGLLVGGISGYLGGRIDSAIMRICEMMMMVPGFSLMLALRAALPPNLSSAQIYMAIVIILSFIGWAGIARIIRGMTLSLRERDYVLAARTQGLNDFHIVRRHILPHTFSYAIVAIALSIPGYILGEAGLSFIGLGIQDPDPSWGNLLNDTMNIVRIRIYPWILTPGFLIGITVVCFNILGEALRDIYDPLNVERI